MSHNRFFVPAYTLSLATIGAFAVLGAASSTLNEIVAQGVSVNPVVSTFVRIASCFAGAMIGGKLGTRLGETANIANAFQLSQVDLESGNRLTR